MELALADDIMAPFKHRLFTTVPKELELGSNLIVLTDIDFWSNHYDELLDWCQLHDAKPEGMTVKLKNKKQLTLFILKWGQ